MIAILTYMNEKSLTAGSLMEHSQLIPTTFPVACHTDNVGPGSIFVAIKGMKDDGLRHIPEAINRGAAKIIVQDDAEITPEVKQKLELARIPVQRVANTRKALAELSTQAHHYPASKLKIIGLTGTKGKTTTAFLLEHILKTAGYKTALMGTVTNRILDNDIPASLTTPQPDYLHVFLDQCVKQGVEWVIMEAAAQAFTLDRLEGIFFEAAIYTNFSQEHGEFYQSINDYFEAKKLILGHLRPQNPLILNADDSRVAALGENHPNSLLFSSQQHPGATLQATLLSSTRDGIRGTLVGPNNSLSIENRQLLGAFNLANCAAATLCLQSLGIDDAVIAKAINIFPGVKGRLNRYDLPKSITAFIDHAHTASSFDAVLSTLKPLADHLIVVFGAGGDRDALKRPHMGRLAAQYGDLVIITTDNPRSEDPQKIVDDISAGIPPELRHKVMIEPDREIAINEAYRRAKPGAFIALLGKGSDEYQLTKGIKTPFSERAILEKIMQKTQVA